MFFRKKMLFAQRSSRSSLFTPRSLFTRPSAECPYCLQRTAVGDGSEESICEHCDKRLTRVYLQDSSAAKPFYIPIVGWPKVGKTVWLYSLTRRIWDLQAPWAWPNLVVKPGDHATAEFMREVKTATEHGIVPPSTGPGVQESYLIVMTGMPNWHACSFVFRDCAGENFDNFIIPEEQISFVKASRVAFFVISLDDLEKVRKSESESSRTMEELLLCYVNTLAEAGCRIRTENRRIILILSKADKLQKKLPRTAYDYLVSDPIARALDSQDPSDAFRQEKMQQYMRDLTATSDLLQDWLSTTVDGHKFIRLAEDQMIDLKISLISSLGGDVSEAQPHRTTHSWTPYRALDPFFWALSFQT